MSNTNEDLLQRVQEASHRLDVYVGERKVGLLERAGAAGSVFAYLPDAGPDDFASLLMPVRRESYSSNRGLIPIFQQNLPEGFLRRKMVEAFGKTLATDDYMLLAITGADTIGRVRVVPSGFDLHWRRPMDVEIGTMLHTQDSSSLFSELLQKYQGQGVSGALPKALVHTSIHSDKWILKIAGSDMASLAVNEFFTMQACARAGLATPKCLLSDDGEALAVERFDVDQHGHPLAFEDFCALLALPTEAKYQGTMERVFKAIDAFTKGVRRLEAKETMIAAQMFSMAAQNTDAHVKNFGLLYDGIEDVRLAPMFDIVTTRVYGQLRNDVTAITMAGKRLTAVDKTFVRFAQERAGLSVRALREMGERISRALLETSADVTRYGSDHPRHHVVCDAMVKEWARGVAMIEGFTTDAVRSKVSQAPKPVEVQPNEPVPRERG